jgi:hypothetical protein
MKRSLLFARANLTFRRQFQLRKFGRTLRPLPLGIYAAISNRNNARLENTVSH